jgi:hypothetical protein
VCVCSPLWKDTPACGSGGPVHTHAHTHTHTHIHSHTRTHTYTHTHTPQWRGTPACKSGASLNCCYTTIRPFYTFITPLLHFHYTYHNRQVLLCATAMVRCSGHHPIALLCFSSVTMVLQWCYSGVTVVLQWCHSGVTVVLERHSCVRERWSDAADTMLSPYDMWCWNEPVAWRVSKSWNSV